MEQKVATSGNGGSQGNILPLFVDTAEELLEGMKAVFPECDKIQKKLRKFRAFVKSEPEVDPTTGAVLLPAQVKVEGAKAFIKQWHAEVAPYYDAIRKRLVDTVMNAPLSLVTELDLRTKWQDPDLDEESKNNFFQYIDTLNLHAQMYCSIPPSMLSKVENMAQGLAHQLQNGQGLADLNIFRMGEELLHNASEEELAEFANNIGSMQHMIQATLSSMGGGEDISSIMAMGNVPGMPNMGGVMQIMQMLNQNPAANSNNGSQNSQSSAPRFLQ